MEPTSPWNNLEIIKVAASILIPIAIVFLGFWVNKRLNVLTSQRERDREIEQDLRNEEKRRRDAEEQKKREELERRFAPHIEFDIDCRFFGPQQGKYAAEFVLTANNKGITRHEFRSIRLRVRGIRQDKPLTFWTEVYEHRLEFPVKIIEDEVKPKDLNYIFIEPGIKQFLSYQTIIESEIKYITAHAEFFYDKEKYTPHSTEKIFEVYSNKSIINT